MKTYYYLIDGNIIPENLVSYFQESDYISKRSKGIEVEKQLDMVGIIIAPDVEIYVFPKNFNNPSEKNRNLILNVILKYFNKNEHLNLYKNDDFYTNFPFNSFFEIYNYYSNHGLYYEEDIIYERGLNGKISWKRSLVPSNMIMTENGLLLTTFIIKGNRKTENIITRAVITAINITSKVFSNFLNIEPIDNGYIEKQFIENPEIIVEELILLKSNVYKDLHISLINNLIDFYNNVHRGGTIQFKHYNFEVIWEEMVHYYLCNHFLGLKDNILVFSENVIEKIEFERHKVIQVNEAEKFKNIILDHFYQDEKHQYIFDSKYYVDIKEMNYKQISYGFSLKNNSNGFNDNKLESVNALFLPGNREQKIHFKLREELTLNNNFTNLIYEFYLDVETLLILYINS